MAYWILNKGMTILTLITFLILPYSSVAQEQHSSKVQTDQSQLPIEPGSHTSAYRLGVGDHIRIDILGFPEYGGEYLITPNGIVHLPWIEPISVLNLTQQELQEEITTQYTGILKRPFVSVTLTQVRPVTITITGEINHPGVYPVDLGIGGGAQPRLRYPTIPEVLTAAGGTTLSANLHAIQIHRSLPGNQKQVIPINLLQLLETGGHMESLVLQDGDLVFVPTVNNINLSYIPQLASLSFATPVDTPRNITIIGEVTTPGEYVIIGGESRSELRTGGLPTVSWAIRSAGGITQAADLRHIEIHRPTQTGTLITFNVNLWDFVQGQDLHQNTILQDGDTIIIPTVDAIDFEEVVTIGQSSLSPENIRIFIIGERPRNLTGVTREIRLPLNTPMNQALLAADGFINRRVRQSSVDLVRVNRDGTVSKRQIFIDLSANLNYDTNPPLQDGDVIILSRSGLGRFIDFVSTVDQVLSLGEPIRDIANLLEILGYINNR
ncbi:polysaccharide biosynthesis/export family protein [Roseofilum sp. Guam]|uniref:polysaccharide biosynthesis/export family protein n=1 Tax=Roseofilum sp. Guam TaxID=2821502 RepID=UPI001B279CB3|nr:polysaccharide biosynthesis/export family protein [Roseofilum sp. Guam]MBP0028079.1 SLBB domain-containing protein [Roseofilum sp. Guam]